MFPGFFDALIQQEQEIWIRRKIHTIVLNFSLNRTEGLRRYEKPCKYAEDS